MKRLILITIILLTWTPVQAGMLIDGCTAAGGGLNWDNVTFFLNFEANDTTGDYNMATTDCSSICEYYGSGDGSGSYLGTAALDNSGAVGNYSLISTSAAPLSVSFNPTTNTAMPSAAGQVNVWYKMSGASWQSGNLIFVGRNATGAYDGLTVNTSSDGNVSLVIRSGGSSNTYTSTSGPCAIDTWYVITMTYDYSNDSYAVYVDGTLAVSTTDTYDTPTFNEIRMGMNGVTYRSHYIDALWILSTTDASDGYALRNATGYGQ